MKHPLVGRVTFDNGLATEKAHDGRLGWSWGRRKASGLLGRARVGCALGSQQDGEDDGELNLAKEVACRVYRAMELRRAVSVAEARELEVDRAGCSKGRGEEALGVHVAW